MLVTFFPFVARFPTHIADVSPLTLILHLRAFVVVPVVAWLIPLGKLPPLSLFANGVFARRFGLDRDSDGINVSHLEVGELLMIP
jgi:hypothetical protein